MVAPRRISDFKPLFTNLAQTSHYLVQFGISQNQDLIKYLTKRGVDPRFIQESAGLLVRNANIPTTSFATVESFDYLGITEKVAYNRQFTQTQMEVYVDSEYKTLKFFEHWMEFIASGAHNQSLTPPAERKPEVPITRKNYITRFQFPEHYKSNATKIIKFERDYKRQLEYNFVGLFPMSMSEIAVSYQDSQIMTVGVSFMYDRYIAGQNSSLAESTNRSNNQENESYAEFFKDRNVTNLSTDQITKIYREPDKYKFASDAGVDTSNIEWPKTFATTKIIQTSFRSF